MGLKIETDFGARAALRIRSGVGRTCMTDNCSFRVSLISLRTRYDAAEPLQSDISGPVLNLATVRFQVVGAHVTLVMPP